MTQVAIFALFAVGLLSTLTGVMAVLSMLRYRRLHQNLPEPTHAQFPRRYIDRIITEDRPIETEVDPDEIPLSSDQLSGRVVSEQVVIMIEPDEDETLAPKRRRQRANIKRIITHLETHSKAG